MARVREMDVGFCTVGRRVLAAIGDGATALLM
jgi:hypothetical protein